MDVPGGLRKVLLLSIATGWLCKGTEPSRTPPVISAALLPSAQGQLQPHELCPRAEGLGQGLERTQQRPQGPTHPPTPPLMLPSLLACSGLPGTLWLGSPPPQGCLDRAPHAQAVLWGCGEGLQQLLMPCTDVWGTWDRGVLPEGCESLGSVIPWKWRVLRKLCQDQCRVCLGVTLTPSSVTCSAFSVPTYPEPSVPDSAGW